MSTVSLISSGPSEDGDHERESRGASAKMNRCSIKLGIIFGIAVVLIIGGLAVGILWSCIFNSILLKELVLTPTSKSYSMWKETPIPMYLELYLYNWTNPEEFGSAATTKPNFVETGPYVFREVHAKVNQVWNDNDTVTFQQKRVWHFEESMSNGSLSDNITNINVVAATVGYAVRAKSYLMRKAVDLIMKDLGETRVVTKTARELLFDGYEDKLLRFLKRLNMSGFDIPYDNFGWFYLRNNSETYDGTFNMFTGAANINNLGIVDKWNYVENTGFYEGPCGLVNGTTGELWPPLNNNQTVSVFASDVCTSMTLTRTDDIEYMGMTGHKFVSDENFLDNGTNVPSRACYCSNVECQPSGTLNVSLCKFGAPAFVSLPHFYLADESYRDAITGMNPVKEEHEFLMSMEPTAGIPMEVKAQLQINILVQPIRGITMFTNIPKIYIPVLWFRQEANLTDEYARQIKFLLVLPTLGHVTFFGICGIGLLIGILGTVLCVRGWRNGEDGKVLLSKEDTDTGVKTDE